MSSVTSNTCAIILNWNGWRDTLDCLQSLADARSRPGSIVVCDNASTDGSGERILNWATGHFGHSRIERLVSEEIEGRSSIATSPFVFIQNPRNLGFSAGNNPGIRWALAQGCFDFVWLLNNDTRVHVDALAHLCSLAREQTRIGIAGSTVVRADTRDKLECAGGCWYEPATTIVRRALCDEPLAHILRAPPKLRLDYIYGVSMFVRSDVFRDVGLLNEAYFLFYEELDLCTRARKAGYDIAWVPQSIVYHKGGASVGSSMGRTGLPDRGKVVFANYHENISTLLFTKNFYPRILPLTLFCRFFGKLAAVIWRGELDLIMPLVRAYMDFGKHLLS